MWLDDYLDSGPGLLGTSADETKPATGLGVFVFSLSLVDQPS
jgi:hypothetical protein